MSTGQIKSTDKPCCKRMKDEVVYSDKGMYEDDNLIIVAGRGEHRELYYLCHNKNTRDTMPLGQCLWCGKFL